MVERYSCSRLKTRNFKTPLSWGCSRVQRGVKFTVNSTNSKSRKRDELNWTASLWMLFDMTQWWNEQRKANPRNSHAGSWCIPIQTALKVASTLQPPAYNSSYAQWKSYDSYASGTNTSSYLTFPCPPPTCIDAKVMPFPGPSFQAIQHRTTYIEISLDFVLYSVYSYFTYLVKRHIQCLLLVFDNSIFFLIFSH